MGWNTLVAFNAPVPVCLWCLFDRLANTAARQRTDARAKVGRLTRARDRRDPGARGAGGPRGGADSRAEPGPRFFCLLVFLRL